MISKDLVINLLNELQEGPYWDFKREWYAEGKEGDLLHDILCMSNNLHNRDAYIIIGIDEEKDFSIRDTRNDPNRKNTQNLVDFLRTKKFAGDVRPIVFVSPVSFGDKYIDVIVIKNSNTTPFYLLERYRQVNAMNIYTRVQDSNTPVDKSADVGHVEYLWRKRFGLESTPLERVFSYLKSSDDWNNSPAEEGLKYYKFFPEFTIGYKYDFDDNRTAQEYYHFYQTDSSPIWADITIKYHQTVLQQYTGLLLDGGRYFTPCPEWDGISLFDSHSWDVRFCYMVKNSMRYAIHEFYFDSKNMEERWSNRRFVDAILIFETDEERMYFKEYVERNWNHYSSLKDDDLRLPYIPEDENRNMKKYYDDARNVQILKWALEDFRSER